MALPPVSRRLAPLALSAALLTACALVVVLAQKNRALRGQVSHLATAVGADYAARFVPAVSARSLDGAEVVLGAPTSGAQILYFFTPTCPHCRASVPAIRALAKAAAGHQLVGVVEARPEEAAEYARSADFGFPIARLPDDRARALFRARDVPMLLVVDGGGHVHYRRVGALSHEHVQAALAAAAPLATSSLSPSTTRSQP